MKKVEWRFARIVLLAVIGFILALLLISCNDEPVGFPENDCCTSAYIISNNDYPNSDPNYYYEGDWTEWMVLREWEDGDSFIVVLEYCDTQEYLGKYIIKMID